MANELRSCAPEAFAAYDVLYATVDATADPALVATARALVVRTLGVGDRHHGVDPAVHPAVRTFAAQFVVDVGSMTDEQRAAATSALGAQAFDFAQLLYVFDWGTRLRAGFEQLFGADPFDAEAAAAPTGSLWEALE